MINNFLSFQIIHGAAGRRHLPWLSGRLQRSQHPQLGLRTWEALRGRPLMADQPGQTEGILRTVRKRDGRPRHEGPDHPGQLLSVTETSSRSERVVSVVSGV